jgi:hypothetical protein
MTKRKNAKRKRNVLKLKKRSHFMTCIFEKKLLTWKMAKRKRSYVFE